MKQIIVDNNLEAISEAVVNADSTLKRWKVKDEERTKSTLALEELLVKLSYSMDKGEKMHLQLKRNYRRINIRICAKGQQIELGRSGDTDMSQLGEEYGPEVENAIRDLILRSSDEQISTSYNKGVNKINLVVHKNDKVMIYDTLLALILAIVSAIALRCFLPTDTVTTIADNVYSPLYTIFIRAIFAVVGPMIFFSLAACIASLKDISSLGRMGIKIVGCYLLTTLCAILITLGYNALFAPGEGANILLSYDTLVSEDVGQTSILNTFINIIPDNIFGAFVNADMLQILFIGIFVGIASAGDNKYSVKLRNGIDVMDHLVQKLVRYCIAIMPIAVFGAVGSMICTLDVSAFHVVCEWFFATLILTLSMLLVYCLLIFLFTGLKPNVFIHKFLEAQITALSTGSSCATIPITLKCCKNLGISPRLYNFSIPLGASINMDGTSIAFSMTGLFLANICGIQMDASTLSSFVITILMLSVALPGAPGGGIAALLIVLKTIGVPAEYATLVVGLIPFFEIIDTVTNVTGDAAVSLIVAKSEGLLDKEVYYNKEKK